ncbi:MAG: hypothetical protein PHQ23_13790, partial [Candidatus Wallbacteria bacterium]|nr:hypothetical protein [Candidatus Wallbacteria bacterium]
GEISTSEDELLSRIKDDLLLKIENQKKIVEGLKTELDEGIEKQQQLADRCRSLESRCDDWEEKHKQAVDRGDKIEQEKNRLQKTIREKESELFEQTGKITRLDGELEKRQENIRDMEIKIRQLEDELSDKNSLQQELNNIKLERKAFDEKMKHLRSQIELLGTYALNISRE